MEENYRIIPVDPETFEYQEYSDTDSNIISQQVIDTDFVQETDLIEFYIYDENKTLLFPLYEGFKYTTYSVRESNVILDPAQDLVNEGFYEGGYFAYYTFFRKVANSSPESQYYIDQISSDRTELKLRTFQISDSDVVSGTNEFIASREAADYFVDFQLNFGLNRQVIANNILLDNTLEDVPTVLVKLYEPLPQAFQLKDTLYLVEEISTPQAYSVDFPFQEVEIQDTTPIQGPNFNLNVTQEVGQASDPVTYSEILASPETSSIQQLKSILDEKSITINVDYNKYDNFVKFSSAKSRLQNFFYKTSLIESTTALLDTTIYNVAGATTGSTSYSSSKASLESIIDSTIENFDGYEYFLYFNSGSKYTWPKSTSTLPYKLYSTSSLTVDTWFGSDVEDNLYYGGQVLSASAYDQDNPEWLYRTIPEYLAEDPDNSKYELFIDMIGQHFDNIWLYTKDVTNKFNADNRLDYGISKDLVADAIRDFGLKIYSSNYDQNDLFESFLGIRADGETFLVDGITSTLPVPSGSGLEYVNTEISASSTITPLNDVQKSIYKRVYHNLPFLLKAKGTAAGLRTLISSYGIPDTILETNEYGGAERRPSAYSNDVPTFNYALDFQGAGTAVDTDWVLNTDWSASFDVPNSLMLRFQAENIHSSSLGPTNVNQTIWSTDAGTALVLEYTGSSGIVDSYNGAIVDPEYQYGSLRFYPNGLGAEFSSIYLPFYSGDWYNVMINMDSTSSMSLYAKSRSSEFQSTSQIGFASSSIVATDTTAWRASTTSNFGTAIGAYAAFSGSMQEVRYYTEPILESSFDTFVLNPNSIVGNTINSAPDTLAFRATLGGELYTGSQSVHPQISGSWLA